MRALDDTKALSLLYFSVANGEPPIGIPWETFQKKIIRENYKVYYERKITNFIMLLNIVRSSVLKRHSYLYMARESEQRFDVSEKITVFSLLFLK